MDALRPVQALIPGVRGKILEVLANTEEPITITSLARMAGVSTSQAARAVRPLDAAGMIQRRDVPPSSLISLRRENFVSRLVMDLTTLHHDAIAAMREAARTLSPAPASLILFGSFARGTAIATSDLDVLAVRARTVAAGDDAWTDTLGRWTDLARAITGNSVNLIEVGQSEVRALVRRPRPLWREILRDGITLVGNPLAGQDRGRRAG